MQAVERRWQPQRKPRKVSSARNTQSSHEVTIYFTLCREHETATTAATEPSAR